MPASVKAREPEPPPAKPREQAPQPAPEQTVREDTDDPAARTAAAAAMKYPTQAVPLAEQDPKSVDTLNAIIAALLRHVDVEPLRSGHGYRGVYLRSRRTDGIFAQWWPRFGEAIRDQLARRTWSGTEELYPALTPDDALLLAPAKTCVLEYVADVRAAMDEILRMAGDVENVYVVTVQPWTLTATLHPRARWAGIADAHTVSMGPITALHRSFAAGVVLGLAAVSATSDRPAEAEVERDVEDGAIDAYSIVQVDKDFE